MTTLLVDTSVVVKWVHSANEAELAEARALRDAHVRGDLDVHILDLGLYEVGNVLLRALSWPAQDVSDTIDDLIDIVGPPLAMERAWIGEAARLGESRDLTFYDASWAAAAKELEVALVSADAKLIAAGLAESPSAAAGRLGLV